MLVISRKKSESLIINEDITVVVIDIRGDKVRLGVEAPKHLPIYRNEVYEAIRRIQRQCAPECVTPSDVEPSRPSFPPVEEPRAFAPQESSTAVAAPPARDGLCCPQCGSDAVDVARIKIAYQGKELVRRRKCTPCGHEFHTIERVEQL